MSPLIQAGNVASIIGFFFAAFTLKWIARVLHSFGLIDVKVGASPDRAGRVAGLAALLLHPAPWLLLIGVAYLAHWAVAMRDTTTRVVVLSWSIGTYVVVVTLAIRTIIRQSQR